MATPTTAMVRSELRLFTREPGSIFWIIGFPVLLIVVLGFVPVMREPIDGLGGVSLIALYIPVAVLLAMLMAAVSAMPVVLASYRERRILRRFATTPVRPRAVLAAQYGIYGSAATVGGLLAVLIGRFAYGVPLPQNLPGFILVFLLVLAAALSIGGIIASLAPTGKVATAIGTAVLFPLMFTAGVWLPVQAMPGLLGDIVSFTPFGAGSLALAATWVGDWPSLLDLGVVAAWTLVLGVVATRYFRWE